MSGHKVCDDLLKTPWQKYDTKSSSAAEKPGIYAIGQKGNNGEETKYLYVGKSNNMKRRLQEHKSPTPQQDIDKRVAGKFKQHRESELRIKCVETKRQKTVEGHALKVWQRRKDIFLSWTSAKETVQHAQWKAVHKKVDQKCNHLVEDPLLSEPSDCLEERRMCEHLAVPLGSVLKHVQCRPYELLSGHPVGESSTTWQKHPSLL